MNIARLKNIERWEEDILRCIRCGNCQAVCPVFQELGEEPYVARGKVQLAYLLLLGRIKCSRKLREIFNLCLTCKSCVENCPSGVRVDEIVLAVRAELFGQQGLPLIKSLFFQGIRNPALLDRGARLGYLLQKIAGLNTCFTMPPLAQRTLKEELPAVIPPHKKTGIKAVFFSGCLINYVYTDIGKSLVRVLNRNGVEVFVPPGQHCCGFPSLNAGNWYTAFQAARSNIEVLDSEKFDVILTACPTCARALKSYYPLLLKEDRRAKVLSEKVLDVSEFLYGYLNINELRALQFSETVTYHDPCHLARGLGIVDEPRQMLKKISGLKLIEMNNAGRCCGGAGFFGFEHYDLSKRILVPKIEAVISTGASCLVTGCPACIMQFSGSLKTHNVDLPVLHTIQVLDRAYK